MAGDAVVELGELGFAVRGDECIEWGAGLSNGYGAVNVKKRNGKWVPIGVHRAMREIIEGESDLHTLHSCGNKVCFNLDHTRYGTPSDNMQDRFLLNETMNFGEGCHFAKLTQAQVDDIRSRYVRGWDRNNRGNGSELRAEYDISSATLSRIVTGVAWVH